MTRGWAPPVGPGPAQHLSDRGSQPRPPEEPEAAGGSGAGEGGEGRGRTAALPVGAPSVAESDAPRRAVGTPSGGEGVNGPGPTQQKENFIMK